MSLVRDRFWIDPASLDTPRAELRRSIFRAMVREVVGGADGRATLAVLREGLTGKEGLAEELTDLLGSELPGSFSVIYESWQGKAREEFVARAVYMDQDAGCVCVLSAGQRLADDEPHIDSIWISLAEFQALGELAFPTGRTA